LNNVPEKVKTAKHCMAETEFMNVPGRPGSSSTSCVSEKICYIPDYVTVAKEAKDLKCGLTVKINVLQK
jgi:hypothetical protein